jgi:hypothetical protein
MAGRNLTEKGVPQRRCKSKLAQPAIPIFSQLFLAYYKLKYYDLYTVGKVFSSPFIW